MAVFSYPIDVRFQHCDPAGIVFYPRYFEMFNLVVENWFDKSLDHSFKKNHDVLKFGIPTVHITTNFTAPSFLEDQINFQLAVQSVGTSSLKLKIKGWCEGELRCTVNLTIVCIGLSSRKAQSWPDQIRYRLTQFQET